MKKTSGFSATIARLSAKAHNGGITIADWMMARPLLFEIKSGMHGRTGRSSQKSEVLAWLRERAAGTPITAQLKEAATKKFGAKRYLINRWLREGD